MPAGSIQSLHSLLLSNFSGKLDESFEFGNSGESGNSCKFSKCGDFEKKSVKSGAYRKKWNGQFDNSIKSGAYENFGVLCKFVILVNQMIFKKSY